MRLFIAIEIPDKVKDYLAKIQEKIGSNDTKMRFVHKKGMHLTLKFFGEIQPKMMKEVKKELNNVNFDSFSLKLDSLGVFSSEKYIRVVWVGLKPEDRILQLQNGIDSLLNKWFKKEKDFKTHLTLARVKFVKDKEKFMQMLKEIKIENKKFEVNSFKLVKSTLRKEGAVYEDLGVFGNV